jgi:hypothetical protein
VDGLGIVLVVIPTLVVIAAVLTWNTFVGRAIEYARRQQRARAIERRRAEL